MSVPDTLGLVDGDGLERPQGVQGLREQVFRHYSVYGPSTLARVKDDPRWVGGGLLYDHTSTRENRSAPGVSPPLLPLWAPVLDPRGGYGPVTVAHRASLGS